MSYTYKNKTDTELVIMNVGVVKAEGTITVDREINNPNLELVKDGEKKPQRRTGNK